MLRSLRVRLVVFLLVPVAVAGGLALVLTSRTVASYERDQTEARLRDQAPGVARILGQNARKALVQEGTPINIAAAVRRITNASIYFIRNPGPGFRFPTNLAEWNGLKLDWNAINRGEELASFEAVPPGKHTTYVVVVSGVFTNRSYRADPSGAIDAFGAIALARPLSSLAPTPRFWARRLAPVFVIGAAAAMVLGLLLGVAIAAPLRRLVAAAGAIARGEFTVSLDRRRKDEFGRLNRAFGDMADQLRAAREHERLFLMRVSHELRTPLTAIQGHVGALADGVIETTADRDVAYGVIASEAVRLERLIRDLLDLAKLEADRFALNREEVDLDALLDAAVVARRESARSGRVELVLEPHAVGLIEGDGDRVLQVVANLLDNALRWTPAGGVIRVAATPNGPAIEVAIADSGPGVPADRRDDVFRPFYSEDTNGTGLGLAIAAELTGAMGGSIVVADAPEGGALFTCVIPRASPVRSVTDR